MRKRTRHCNNPLPGSRGQSCTGLDTESANCIVDSCHGIYNFYMALITYYFKLSLKQNNIVYLQKCRLFMVYLLYIIQKGVELSHRVSQRVDLITPTEEGLSVHSKIVLWYHIQFHGKLLLFLPKLPILTGHFVEALSSVTIMF